MSLFLKYRPQTFSDVVGQTSIIKTLQNALKNDKCAHAYLFSGSRGTGKTSTARIFAKGINCSNLSDGSPCAECEFCRDTADGNLVDVIEIDAASNRGIDEIRELREKILFAPTRAKSKVYIIDEVHMLTKEAFNALLKTLEEPPEHAFFLLATTELHKLPETIISRCQTFVFQRFTLEQLTGKLEDICQKEGFTHETKALELIARKAEGGLRDAISLLDQIAAETDKQITESAVFDSLGISSSGTLEKFWNGIQSGDTEASLEVLRGISNEGKDFRTFGHDFLGFLREKLHQSLNTPETLGQILPAIEEIEKALGRLKTSPIVELPLEIAVVNLCGGGNTESRGKNQEVKKELGIKNQESRIETKQTPSIPLSKGEEIAKEAPAKIPPLARGAEGGLEEKQTTESTKESTDSAEEPKTEVSSIEKPEPQASNATDGFIFDETPAQTERAHQKIEEPKQESRIEDLEPSEAKISPATPLSDIASRMRDIADKAGIPSFAKKSFLTTKPQLGSGKISFLADSDFHQEKLQTESIRIALQNTIVEMFGEKVMIEFTLSSEAKEVATADDFLNF